MAITHPFVSAKGDGADNSIVQASDWNDSHAHGTEAANLVFAGPGSGANAVPTFRALVVADIPSGVDHGGLGGLTDDDHTQYLLASGTRVGSTSQAQDFSSTGIKADIIAESTNNTGVTVDGLLIKDSVIPDAGYPNAVLVDGSRALTANWDVGAFNISVPAAASTPRVELLSSGDLAFTSRPFPPDNPVITSGGVTVMTMVGNTGVLIDLCAGITMSGTGATSDLDFNTAATGVQYAGNDRIEFESSVVAAATMHFPSLNPIRTGDGAVLWDFGGLTAVNATAGMGFSFVSNAASPTIVQGGSFNVGWSGTGTAPLVLGAEMFGALQGTGTVTKLVGLRSRVVIGAAGTVDESIAHEIVVPDFSGAQPTTHAGQRIENQGVSGVTTSHALLIEAQSGSTNNRSIEVQGSAVSIHAPPLRVGDSTVPTEDLEIANRMEWFDGTSFGGRFVHANSADRDYTFPDAAGTVALTSDLHNESHTLASHSAKAHADLSDAPTDAHHNATHASAHEPSGGDTMTVDAVTGTGSLRTLGTGAQQAAVGTHGHAGGAHDTKGGSVSVTEGTVTTVTFATAFSGTPDVVLCVLSTTTSIEAAMCSNVSTTSFDITLEKHAGGGNITRTVVWIATSAGDP